MILNLVLLALCTVVADSQSATFCGLISRDEASGAGGYFQANFAPGVAQYAYSLDLSDFDLSSLGDDAATCDLSQGLDWHIHTYWTEAEQSAAGAACSTCGGHYDPSL